MKLLNFILLRIGFILICILPLKILAQTSIDWSVYNGLSLTYSNIFMDTMANHIYVLGVTNSTDFTTTNYSTLAVQDIFVSKYDMDGNRKYAKLIGSSGTDELLKVLFEKDNIYILGKSNANDFPSTNSFDYKNNDLVVAIIDTSGTVTKAKYLGTNSAGDQAISLNFIENHLYVGGNVQSAGYPVTNGSTFDALTDIVFTKLDLNLNIKYSTYLGGNNREYFSKVIYQKGKIAMVGSTLSTNFSTTNGSSYKGGLDIFCTFFDTAGGIYSSSLHGSVSSNNFIDFLFVDTAVYIEGYSSDGSSFSNPFTDIYGIPKVTGVLGVQIDGNEIFSTALGNYQMGKVGQLKYYNNALYYLGSISDTTYRRTNTNPYQSGLDYFYTKLDLKGNLVHSFLFGGSNEDYPQQYRSFFYIKDNAIHLHGVTLSPDIPSTNGSSLSGGFDNILYRFDTAGNQELAIYLGGKVNDIDRFLEKNNEYYTFNQTYSNDFPATNNSVYNGNGDIIISKINAQGQTQISSFLGGENLEDVKKVLLLGEKILIFGNTESKRFPVTLNESSKLGLPSNSNNKVSNFYLTMMNFCPEGFDTTQDVLSPSIQNVCKNGFVEQIIGKRMLIPGDSLLDIYKNTIAYKQPEVEAKYQWQVANNISGPWSNIFGAVLKDYSPNPTLSNKYYRRISRTHPCCGSSIIHISAVSSIVVNTYIAPTADAGGLFNTCPNSAITIGGSPSATGGTSPYRYSWDKITAPDSSYSNPSIAPTTNSVYTLTIIDSNDCVQKDQCLVSVYKADAGNDVWACANDSVKIQTRLPQGLTGVTYAWTPSAGLSDITIAQPMANPITSTTYYLTQTIPKTGGGTCSTLDTLVVEKVNGPTTLNFAGTDDTICHYNTKYFSPNLSGLPSNTEYSWTPNKYLDNDLTYYASHNPNPKSTIIQPNPIIYTLTAKVGECYFTDDVSLAVIYAKPNLSGCDLSGEQTITNYDVPNLNEDFSWTKLSGPGTILGSSTSNNLHVDMGSGSSSFQIETTLGSTTCTETILSSGCGCGLNFSVFCPSKFGDPIRIVGSPTIGSANDYYYSWTPALDLNRYDSSVVYMNGTTARTYTVVIKSKTDTTFSCNGVVSIDPSDFVIPVITALDDTVCPGEVLHLGETLDPGHKYKWVNASLVSNHEASNPMHKASNSVNIYVTKTNINTGCVGKDTSSITVNDVFANAGDDKTICSSTTLQLGTTALQNCKYKWIPSNASYQNGTTDSSAQPELLVATSQTFSLTVTDTITGCIAYDTVNIEVNGLPTIPNFPDTFLCKGSTKKLGFPAQSGITYSWSPATGLNNPNIAQPMCNTSTSINYTVTAYFPGGCSAQDNIYVTVHDPSFGLNDINYCPSSGSFAIGNAVPAGMSTYQWSPSSLLTSGAIRNPSTLNPPPSGITNFTIEVTDANGCKADTFLNIIPTLAEPLAGPDKTFCKYGNTTIGSNANSTGTGITYTWNPILGLNNNVSPNPTCTLNDTGSFQYILTKVNTFNSCTSRDTVEIRVIEYDINPTTPSAICKNGSQDIGVPNEIGSSYFWSPTTYLNDSTTSIVTASPPQTTTYTLTAIGANGCSDQENIVVGVRNTVVPTIMAPNVDTCIQDSIITLFASISPVGNYGYYWSPNNGTVVNPNIEDAEIKLTQEGSFLYNLEVTDSTGCKVNKDVGLSIRVCTLPVELLSFSVKQDTDLGILDWTTVTEINNSHFEIEKSLDGQNWFNIGRVNSRGDGNFTGISNYVYEDQTLVEGNNFYRLKQVDFNGKSEYSSIEFLHVNFTNKTSLMVYPNPSSSNIRLASNKSLIIKSINIIDFQGRNIPFKTIKHNEKNWEFITRDFAKGFYYIRVKKLNGEINNLKFIIE